MVALGRGVDEGFPRRWRLRYRTRSALSKTDEDESEPVYTTDVETHLVPGLTRLDRERRILTFILAGTPPYGTNT